MESLLGSIFRDQYAGRAHLHPKSVAIIFNPVSGTNNADARRSIIKQMVHEAGLSCELGATDCDHGATPLARQAVADGVERLIVSGGDGSVTEAAHELAGTPSVLAVIPSGTGNLLAINLGIPLDHEKAMRFALAAPPYPTDIGRANGEAFLIGVGLGLDARMIHDADRELKRNYGLLSYIIAAWRNRNHPDSYYTIVIDGKTLHRAAQSVMVSNLGRITAGLELVVDADPADGLLHLAILKSCHLNDLVRLGWCLLRGRTPSQDLLEVHDGRDITVEADRPLPFQIDGNEAGEITRVEVHVEPGTLQVVRPRKEPTNPSFVTAVGAATNWRVFVPMLIALAALLAMKFRAGRHSNPGHRFSRRAGDHLR